MLTTPPSRRVILEWIMKAKRPETRRQRMKQTVEMAARLCEQTTRRQLLNDSVSPLTTI
jgi:uncharacterized protein YdeI (YjbR/CyaY-like superfamily)